jgi:hypothetical protein
MMLSRLALKHFWAIAETQENGINESEGIFSNNALRRQGFSLLLKRPPTNRHNPTCGF